MLEGVFRAFSSSANLGSGFDVLAVAIDAFHDTVRIRVHRGGTGSIRVTVRGSYSSGIDPHDNTAYVAAKKVLSEANLLSNVDLEIQVFKGIPTGKGLGSSGATAAAVVRGLNKLLGLEIPLNKEVYLAGQAEQVAAGVPHYDNVAASLAGGLVLITLNENGLPAITTFSLRNIAFVIAVPDVPPMPKKTSAMRSVLPNSVTLKEHVIECSRLASLISGLITGDLSLAGKGMIDSGITIARTRFSPAYEIVKQAALKSGALGFSLSGAGPSTIALVPAEDQSIRDVMKGIKKAYESAGVNAVIKPSTPAGGVERIA